MSVLSKVFLAISCCLYFGSLYSQSQAAKDRYQQLLSEAKTENERIDVVNFMVEYMSNINMDSSLTLALVNIEDAKKAGYPEGEFRARRYASTTLVIKDKYESGKRQLTESYNLAIQMGDSAFISD